MGAALAVGRRRSWPPPAAQRPALRRYQRADALSVAFERGYIDMDDLSPGAELGAAHVRKGEKGSLGVYAHRLTKVETNDRGEEVEREIPFLKGYTVFKFNAEQIDGLPEHYYAKPPPKFAGPVAQPIHHMLSRTLSDPASHCGRY